MNDIKTWQNTTATKEDDDDIAHCLYYHEEYREACPINDCIFSKSQNFKINRYAQFHLQFFHNQAIDDDDKEGAIKEQKEEKIEYKPANIKTGVLQFGTPFVIDDKLEAKFKDPKKEVLNNKYHSLQPVEWNTVRRNCVEFVNLKEAKLCGMSIYDILVIKLYTDFDDLQKEFKLCFRSSVDQKERRERQRHFYHWHVCLKEACGKSKDVINQKLYHGVNCILSPSTMNGTYYGPVSTTTDYNIAKKFAGEDGQILEVYPSFGRKGLDVSWLSNFPDEREVLFYGTSLAIANVMTGNVGIPKDQRQSSMEQSILNTLQNINVASSVLSLNESSSKDSDDSILQNIDNYDKLWILYLLYVQYKPSEWDKIQKEKSSFFINAIMKFRDQFITLAQRVEAVSMDKMSKLLQMFFYSDLTKFSLPILSNNHQQINVSQMEKAFLPNQFFNFSTIIRLFPCAKQITVNADNFDWSLNKFIHFLSLYDFEFHHIKLQDIFIRNIKEEDARKKIFNDNNNTRENVYKLRKMGWKFSTPLHLHRCDVEPLPELPFLFVFENDKKSGQRVAYRTPSLKLAWNSSMLTPRGDDEHDEQVALKNRMSNPTTPESKFPFGKAQNIATSVINHLSPSDLMHQENWDIMVDAIYLNTSQSDCIQILKRLRFIASNLFKEHDKYRELVVSKPKIKGILSSTGGLEFLRGLGFKKLTSKKLVCREPDRKVIDAAIASVDTQLAMLNPQHASNKKKKNKVDQMQKPRLSPMNTYSFGARLSLSPCVTPSYDNDESEGDDEKSATGKMEKKKDSGFVMVDHNPKNCILSKRIFENLPYKQPLIEMLESRLMGTKLVLDVSGKKKHFNKFIDACLKVESLVLDPLPSELHKIFQAKNKYVSFEAIIKLFPNLTDLFLCSTTLSPMICFKFIAFAKKYNENEGTFDLQRIFYSKQKPLKQRDVALVKMRLKEIGWNFVKSQQMICKY